MFTRQLADPEAYDYIESHLHIDQNREEALETIEQLRDFFPDGISTIVEIGSYKGGFACFLSRLLRGDGLIVCIEPEIAVEFPSWEVSRLVYPAIVKHIDRFSQEPEALTILEYALEGKGIDLLVIDGSHEYEDAKSDFLTYSPLVNRPGIIIMHDIKSLNPEATCGRYWQEIKGDYGTVEVVGTTGLSPGTGIIFLSDDFRLMDDEEAYKYLKQQFKLYQQDEVEICWLMDIARKYLENPSMILEIGSLCGANLAMLSRLVEDGMLISIDPEVDVSGERIDKQRLEGLIGDNKFHHIKLDSTSVEARNSVAKLTDNFDLVFDDGRHSLQNIKHNFNAYSRLLRSPGMYVIHDLNDSRGEVWRAFSELRENHKSASLAVRKGTMGIGVIFF